jgi:hypothetical protein
MILEQIAQHLFRLAASVGNAKTSMAADPAPRNAPT